MNLRVTAPLLLGLAGAAGCWPSFPDEGLHAPRDAARDQGARVDVRDAGADDLGATDIPAGDTPPVMDTGDIDGGVTDAGGGMDAEMDVVVVPQDGPMIPPDGSACDFAPTAMISSRSVFSVAENATDLVFNGRGGVAVASGSRVVLHAGAGTGTPLVEGLPGAVAAMRYATTGDLVLAVNPDPDGGTTAGSVMTLASGSTTAMQRRMAMGRIGGLAVDRMNQVWFTDQGDNSLWRMSVTGSDAVRVLGPGAGGGVTLTRPGLLAFGPTGRDLYVAAAIGTEQAVYRLELIDGDGGAPTVRAMPERIVETLMSVTGLAVDECGFVYVADGGRSVVFRVSLGRMTEVVQLIGDIRGTRGLAFGQGAMFDERVLFSVSVMENALRAAGTVTRGVPLPVPAM